MMTPVSPQMLTQTDANLVDSLTNGVAKIAAEYDAPFFNYPGASFPVDCWRDANHMNAKGATSFSTIFQNDFNASISTQTHNGVNGVQKL